jgi:Cof subfamily protein (haloacid dehalogenase superfamily)
MGRLDLKYPDIDNKKVMIITDLDGTLLRTDKMVSGRDLSTLKTLGGMNALRVIATGRSLYSAYRAISEDFPIEYLIFSSGAGIVEWKSKTILKKHSLNGRDVGSVIKVLKKGGADFMVHEPIPRNHYFSYYHSGKPNPDFFRRCEIYSDFCSRDDFTTDHYGKACQILVVEPPETGFSLYNSLVGKLSSLKVIRTTSPIDHVSTWIEIFPQRVSKACAAEWLKIRYKIDKAGILAIGNDYNDVDLLEWSNVSFLTGNAPPELKTRFDTVGSNDHSGFSEAVNKWLSTSNNNNTA